MSTSSKSTRAPSDASRAWLTLDEAAPFVGVVGGSPNTTRSRTLRQLRALEREEGVRLIVWIGGEGKGGRPIVVEAALAACLAQSVSRRGDAAAGVLEVDGELGGVAADAERVDSRVRAARR